MNLKDTAVYQLPNGRELVAYMTCDNETVLFNLSNSESGMYELNSEGRLVFDGQLTAWQIDDLIETGRVAGPDATSILAERSPVKRDTTSEQSI
jgi:hypothetical protein